MSDSALIATRESAFEWSSLRVRRDSGFVLDLPALRLLEGTFTIIVGCNGAGKSTLLRALARQGEKVVSDARCFGKALAQWKDKDFAREVAFLPQDRSLCQPDLLAAEVVRLGRYAHGYSEEDHDIVLESLDAVDAGHLAARPMAELSGGERQRIWIAMALAQQARTILLDEPTSFLDWQHQLGLMALLQRLHAQRGVTIITVLHDLNLALSAKADWLVLRAGQLVYHGAPSPFLQEWNLIEVFGVAARVFEHEGRRLLLPDQHTMHAPTVADSANATARCPVRAPSASAQPAASESLFVEKAAADLIGSEKHQGDPEADAMLQSVRDRIYYWPSDFPGFCGRLTVREGTQEYRGGFHAQSSRRYTADLPEYPDAKWLKYQMEELIAHRECTSVSHIASKAGVVFGNTDQIYGRRVDFVGDKMGSFYRLKDSRITQIGRGYGKVRFIINIDSHCDCDGRFAAQNYSVFYFDSTTGNLTKTESYYDRYERFGDLWLPVERRVSEATDSGLRTRQILLQEIYVIERRAAA